MEFWQFPTTNQEKLLSWLPGGKFSEKDSSNWPRSIIGLFLSMWIFTRCCQVCLLPQWINSMDLWAPTADLWALNMSFKQLFKPSQLDGELGKFDYF